MKTYINKGKRVFSIKIYEMGILVYTKRIIYIYIKVSPPDRIITVILHKVIMHILDSNRYGYKGLSTKSVNE